MGKRVEVSTMEGPYWSGFALTDSEKHLAFAAAQR